MRFWVLLKSCAESRGSTNADARPNAREADTTIPTICPIRKVKRPRALLALRQATALGNPGAAFPSFKTLVSTALRGCDNVVGMVVLAAAGPRPPAPGGHPGATLAAPKAF